MARASTASKRSAQTYAVPIDIPKWQTAIETGIGFIPIVGSIVAAGEATFGYDLFGHEPLSPRTVVAAAIILVAVAIIVAARDRLGSGPATEPSARSDAPESARGGPSEIIA